MKIQECFLKLQTLIVSSLTIFSSKRIIQLRSMLREADFTNEFPLQTKLRMHGESCMQLALQILSYSFDMHGELRMHFALHRQVRKSDYELWIKNLVSMIRNSNYF